MKLLIPLSLTLAFLDKNTYTLEWYSGKIIRVYAISLKHKSQTVNHNFIHLDAISTRLVNINLILIALYMWYSPTSIEFCKNLILFKFVKFTN